MKRIFLLFILMAAALLTSCGEKNRNMDEGRLPDLPAEKSPEETEKMVIFPPTGELLDVSCPPYAPLADDGSRFVTILWYPADSDETTEYSYDLSNTRTVLEEPELRLLRQIQTSRLVYPTRPVDGAADRAYLLEQLEAASFQAPDEPPAYVEGNLLLYVTSDGIETTYRVFPDGTLLWAGEDGAVLVAYDAVDYFRLSALAYKYASVPYDVGVNPNGWYALVPLLQSEDMPEELVDQWTPPADSYRLCIQGEELHIDLDRAQALILFRTLFGEENNGEAAMPEFDVPAWDWTAPEGGIRITEYLYTAWTGYQHGEPKVIEQGFFLYPDGSTAQLPTANPGFSYSWKADTTRWEMEKIAPSWQRAAVSKNAFSWETLTACLDALQSP